jgi:hypothetical protein
VDHAQADTNGSYQSWFDAGNSDFPRLAATQVLAQAGAPAGWWANTPYHGLADSDYGWRHWTGVVAQLRHTRVVLDADCDAAADGWDGVAGVWWGGGATCTVAGAITAAEAGWSLDDETCAAEDDPGAWYVVIGMTTNNGATNAYQGTNLTIYRTGQGGSESSCDDAAQNAMDVATIESSCGGVSNRTICTDQGSGDPDSPPEVFWVYELTEVISDNLPCSLGTNIVVPANCDGAGAGATYWRRSSVLGVPNLATNLAATRTPYLQWYDPLGGSGVAVTDEYANAWSTTNGTGPYLLDLFASDEYPYGGASGEGRQGWAVSNRFLLLNWDLDF